MKMKKIKLLFTMVFVMFSIFQFGVYASDDLNAMTNVEICIPDIVYGESQIMETNFICEHISESKVELTWYKSNDNVTYVPMSSTEKFDYNLYYKVIFSRDVADVNESLDEGWECGSIHLEIHDIMHNIVDSKTFVHNSKMEYVYDPIWKYNIKYNVTGITYEGASEIVEGNSLHVTLTPMEGYRLPNISDIEWEHKLMVMSAGGMNNVPYSYNNGILAIDAENITSDIQIDIEGIPVIKLILDANGGTINGESQYIEENFESISDFSIPVRDGYIFKGWYTKAVGGTYLEKNNQISNRMTIYAHWDKEGTSTIDLVNHEEGSHLSDRDSIWFNHLLDKGEIVIDNATGEVRNKEGKLLFAIDTDGGKITFADNLTTKDNIIYVLTDAEKQIYADDRVEDIPNTIELIVSTKEVYKVVFDANGGDFKDGDKTIDIEDIINFNYETFEEPTRNGYKFIGFYTEDGKSYYDIMNSEAGVEEDTTFYAQWQEVSAGGGQAGIPEGGGQEDNNTGNTNTGNTDSGNTNTGNTNTDNTNTGNTNTGNTNTDNTNTNKPTGNNPQTGDNIVLFAVISLIAVVGIVATIKVKKYVK